MSLLRLTLVGLTVTLCFIAQCTLRESVRERTDRMSKLQQENLRLREVLDEVQQVSLDTAQALSESWSPTVVSRELELVHFAAAKAALDARDLEAYDRHRRVAASATFEWGWLQRRAQSMLVELPEQPGFVEALAWSSDFRTLAAVDDEGWCSLWDLDEPGAPTVQRIQISEITLTAVAPHSNMRLWLIADAAGRLCWLDGIHRQKQAELELAEHVALSLAFHESTQQWVVGTESGELLLVDEPTRATTATLSGHNDSVVAVIVGRDEQVLSASLDGSVREWDLATATERRRWELHEDWILGCAMAREKGWLLTGSEDGRSFLLDPEVETPPDAVRHGEIALLSVAISDDGQTMAWGDAAGQVTVTAANVHERLRLAHPNAEAPRRLVADPSLTQLAMASTDSQIRIWRRRQQPSSQILQLADVAQESIAQSKDGLWVLVGRGDGGLVLYQAETWDEVWSAAAHEQAVTAVAISADGQWLVSGGLDRTVKVFSTAQEQPLLVFEGLDDWVTDVAISDDAASVVAMTNDGGFRRWQRQTRAETCVKPGPRAGIFAGAMNRTGTVVAWAADGGVVRVWDTQTGNKLAGLRDSNLGLITSIAVSEDGRSVTCISNYRTVLFWTIDSESTSESQSATEPVLDLAYSLDGRRVFLTTSDSAFEVWDPAAAKRLLKVPGSVAGVQCLSVNSSGSRVIHGGRRGTCELWEVELPSEDSTP